MDNAPFFDPAKNKKGTCGTCGILGSANGVTLKTCSGCKLILYCSSKCQKEGWASHKPACGGHLGKGIKKLIAAATTVPLIQEYIQIWLAVQFKLDEATTPAQRREQAQRPLFAHIDVGIEPADLQDFRRLWDSNSPEHWDHNGVRGMLQFHHMSKPEDWGPGNFHIAPAMMAYWRQARMQADKYPGGTEWPVATVQFVNQLRESCLCGVVVLPQAIAIARKKERIVSYSAPMDSIVSLGFHVASYFTHLNLHIRGDTKNTMHLRTLMRQCDKEMILDAKNNVFGHAPRMFNQKLLREDVYKAVEPLDIPFPLSTPTLGSYDSEPGCVMKIVMIDAQEGTSVVIM